MDNELYSYSPINERPRILWPSGAKLAFYIGLNIEHFVIDAPSTSISLAGAGRFPDPMNQGWRDYGLRVGFWRMLELFDELTLPISVLLNSDVCERYPQVIAAGVERDWVWCLHGKTNSAMHQNLELQEERRVLSDIYAIVAQATGTHPKGWLGPALSETFNTPRLLRELGCTYLLDWCADDQPFHLAEPGMISVPYSLEINDIIIYLDRGMSNADYERTVMDQFDTLLTDSNTSGRVMALPLHPFLTGQPHRFPTLQRILRRIAQADEVWFTTSDEIADHFLAGTQ